MCTTKRRLTNTGVNNRRLTNVSITDVSLTGGKPEMAYTYLSIGLFGVAMSPRTTGTGHRPRQS